MTLLVAGCVGQVDSEVLTAETPAAVAPDGGRDAGVTTVDAGVASLDAGAAAVDAGVPPVVDAGVPLVDAGVDAGSASPPGMVFIPAGSAWIGCNSTAHCYPEEEPYVQVTLSAYWMDQFEVTRAQYAACVNAGVCSMPVNHGESLSQKVNHPVRGVSWSQADQYCRWAGKRLPTIAQWERAARGTTGGVHPWGAALPDCGRLNYASCVGDTTPVGSYPTGATPEGLMDVFGNVWEWTSDDYSATYYSEIGPVDPVGLVTGLGAVFRGGSFSSGDEQAEPWLGYFPDGTIYHERRKSKIGLRCARSP